VLLYEHLRIEANCYRNYYRQNRPSSHVFSCFIDFTKAFDNVDYWLLFCKLLDNVIDNQLVDDKDINKELKSLFMRSNLCCIDVLIVVKCK